MKILERLRGLADELKIEPRNSYPSSLSLIDYDLMEYEDPVSLDLSRHTVDGLRRRIPDVHEEIPPEGYEISDQSERFGSE